jgi:hypothetical protein
VGPLLCWRLMPWRVTAQKNCSKNVLAMPSFREPSIWRLFKRTGGEEMEGVSRLFKK